MKENYIKIKDIIDMAITEEQGFKLRAEINKIIENNNKIILDFTGIQLFTTTFFSASIGYFVLKYSPKECKDRFILTNLSKAGTHAYQCSFENAEHCFFNSSLTGV